MAETADPRVAVYIDFDNIVISQYAQVHGRSRGGQKLKDFDLTDPEVAAKLRDATVDLGAILDYASSFGTVAVSRAYADWAVPANAGYSSQLIERAIDLVQLFPTVASGKNGADIRLALDVAEDLFSLPHLTHVVIVAGDSDYVALAQHCKKLGRYVVGIGVAGSVSRALGYACDEFKDYDKLPGVVPPPVAVEPEAEATAPKSRRASRAQAPTPKSDLEHAGDLLVRALQLGEDKSGEEWQSASAIKNQMLRLDPTFQERALGYSSFTNFAKALSDRVELDDGTTIRKIRIRPAA